MTPVLAQTRRLLSSAVAIVLGVAFVTAALLLGDALNQTLRDAAAGTVRDAQVVVRGRDHAAVPGAFADTVSRAPGVTDVRRDTSVLAQYPGLSGAETVLVAPVPALSDSTVLVAGRLPAAPGEVAANVPASERGAPLDQALGLRVLASETRAESVRVVGVVRAGFDTTPMPGQPMLFAPEPQVLAWNGDAGHAALYVRGEAAPDALRAALRGLPGASDVEVRTASDDVDHQVRAFSGGRDVLVGIVLGFAAVAVFVSGLVIANTFSILVAQRTRQLALLRCVGAGRGQVFGLVLREALGLGAAASVVGVGVGSALALLLVRLSADSPIALSRLVANPVSFVAPLVLGVLLTLVAAVVPARAATRIAPLAALRTGQLAVAERPGRLTTRVGILAAALGGAGLALTAGRGLLAPALLCGAVSFVGVMVATGALIPALARRLAPLWGRLGGIPGELAAENAVRSPRRAAATSGALLVGVTLITLMGVGATSSQATTLADLNARYPIDLQVDPAQPADAQRVRDALAGVPAVQQSVQVRAARVGVRPEGGEERRVNVVGLDPAERTVATSPTFARGLAEGRILVPAHWDVPEGAPVQVSGTAGAVTLRAVTSARSTDPVLVTPTDLARVAPDAAPSLWVRLAPGNAYDAQTAATQAVQAVSPGSTLGGAAPARQEIVHVIDLLLGLAVGLLAVAVLIALVGIGNTLGLSVLERRQESALLRATGLTRSQLRRMVAMEALLLACIATVLGTALGIGYGIAGTFALLGSASGPIVVAIPWARIGLVAAVALLAGLAASVLPASRAARVPPAQALAQD